MRGPFITVLLVAACGGGGGGPGGDDDPAIDAAGGGDGGNPIAPGAGPYFETPMFFNRDVSGEAPAATSATMIAKLRELGGWGNTDTFQIDFSIEVLTAPVGTPMRTFTPTSDFYSPDCDQAEIPVPTTGSIEGETGYACQGGGDCHLLVHDRDGGHLYEMWRADIRSTFNGGCLAVWNTKAEF